MKRSSLIHPLLILCLPALFLTAPVQAADTLGLGGSSQANSLGLEPQEESFLPVEEAYRVQITRPEAGKLALDWQIAPGYYLYQAKFKFKIDQTNLPASFEPGKRKYDDYFQEEVEIFYHQTQVLLSDLPTPPYTLEVTSQGCADAGLCYPPYKQYFTVSDDSSPILENAAAAPGGGSAGPAGGSDNQSTGTSTPFSASIWLTSMLFAMLGGIILNLMPCVFPVLSIKALSLANSHQSNHRLHLHGWAYAAGCVTTFVAIATVMLILRASGEAIGWGFQLQSPAVITLLLYLFFLMGLSFSGVLNLGNSLMGIGQNATQGNQLHHSWMTGALASVVASPCTAPMMGAALGYAVTQPTVIALSIFAALGFGMALPFLLLTHLPQLAKVLPKPGPWMETLKQALAFPLYLSCVWLLWVVANQTDSNHLFWVAAGLVLIAFAAWLLRHLPNHGKGLWLGRGVAAACLIVVGIGTFSYHPPTTDPLWQSYTPEKLASLRQEQRPVFVNLTASWCITCLANERVALGTERVRAAMQARGIQGLKGDWTNADPMITELLKKYGRSGVPLYLYFPPSADAQAVVLPQLLTPEIVITTINSKDGVTLAEN
ncbi:protein-disulfide reductase DsbD [Halioxenophilus sp. WMMB6]|uniref:protein-disulfide reductase DsbD family protein n=1 Tax=Halioxenophilus sp. WMMB6 TaxID=3073815 RepID=UPI00295F5282|nr:protein-disulfide reductase DsbD [Halioxenophilus sp. WMMB6]